MPRAAGRPPEVEGCRLSSPGAHGLRAHAARKPKQEQRSLPTDPTRRCPRLVDRPTETRVGGLSLLLAHPPMAQAYPSAKDELAPRSRVTHVLLTLAGTHPEEQPLQD